ELPSELNGQNLSSGEFISYVKTTLNGTLTLTGDANSIFIINVRDTLVVGNGSQIVLSGVNRSQVFIRATKGIRVAGSATLPVILLSEKSISGGTINGATLLSENKIKIDGGGFSPSVIEARLSSVTRDDAADFFGLNSSNVQRASSQYPSHLS